MAGSGGRGRGGSSRAASGAGVAVAERPQAAQNPRVSDSVASLTSSELNVTFALLAPEIDNNLRLAFRRRPIEERQQIVTQGQRLDRPGARERYFRITLGGNLGTGEIP